MKHQRFVGTGYFDAVEQVIASGTASTTAFADSTETAQFANKNAKAAGKYRIELNSIACGSIRTRLYRGNSRLEGIGTDSA